MIKLLLTLSAFLLTLTGCSSKEAASIGIIGGADGPTAIFVTGGIGIIPLLALVFIAFLIGAFIGYKVYKKRKK